MKKLLNLSLIILVFSYIFFSLVFYFNSAQAQGGVLVGAKILGVCGNGILEIEEVCDHGVDNGQYGYCKADCSGLGIRCGDGIVQSEHGEECDDGNTSSGDGCDSSCQSEPVISGGGGGGGTYLPPVPTKVVLMGKAYPFSDMSILMDGKLIKTVKSDSKADFKAEITDITAGIWSFSVWAKDKNNIKSITYTLTFRVNANTITTVSGIFLPSTIGLNKTSLNKGEILNIFGQTVPEIEVKVHVFSTEHIETVVSDNIGAWLLPFDTIVLEDGSHVIKAQSQITPEEKSGFGQILSFYVGEDRDIDDLDLFCLYADLNKDGRVNLIDFSILLYWFGKYNICADQNGNDVVDLPDFSIMLYHWTG
ncbi:MAG: hypothetical protein CEE43_17135 [Promethearchaeota archaeon Loki_b32]|nr:MAG: hypothetical protein CEE43_17135 [Candidatus Lokiarchaeota archaeon Loki_b32]